MPRVLVASRRWSGLAHSLRRRRPPRHQIGGRGKSNQGLAARSTVSAQIVRPRRRCGEDAGFAGAMASADREALMAGPLYDGLVDVTSLLLGKVALFHWMSGQTSRHALHLPWFSRVW